MAASYASFISDKASTPGTPALLRLPKKVLIISNLDDAFQKYMHNMIIKGKKDVVPNTWKRRAHHNSTITAAAVATDETVEVEVEVASLYFMEPFDFRGEIVEPASSIDSLVPPAADAEDFVEGTPMPPPPEDFLDPSSPQFQSTVYIIAEDLKNIGENEVKDYPLVSLKNEELKLIFNLLDPTTLTAL